MSLLCLFAASTSSEFCRPRMTRISAKEKTSKLGENSRRLAAYILLANAAVGKGERDRPGRSVRRLAEQLVQFLAPFVAFGRVLPDRRRDADESSRDEGTPHQSTKFRLPSHRRAE